MGSNVTFTSRRVEPEGVRIYAAGTSYHIFNLYFIFSIFFESYWLLFTWNTCRKRREASNDQYKSGPLGRSLRTDTCEVPLFKKSLRGQPFYKKRSPYTSLHGFGTTPPGGWGVPPYPPLFHRQAWVVRSGRGFIKRVFFFLGKMFFFMMHFFKK